MEAALGHLIQADLASIRGTAEGLAGTPTVLPALLADAGSPPGADFAAALKSAVHSVDAKDHDAGERMAAVDSGRSDDLVGAMLASQDASLSFSMLMQVRNKVMGAVEDLIKLPL